jgi:hypothetical protein
VGSCQRSERTLLYTNTTDALSVIAPSKHTPHSDVELRPWQKLTGTTPSVITALQLSELPRSLIAEPPSSDHNFSKRHKRKNVVPRKRWRIWNLRYLYFLLQMISPTTSLSIVLEFWITLCIKRFFNTRTRCCRIVTYLLYVSLSADDELCLSAQYLSHAATNASFWCEIY